MLLSCVRLAALCRKDSLSSADKAATRRLVRSTIAKAVDTEGRDLGEVFPAPLRSQNPRPVPFLSFAPEGPLVAQGNHHNRRIRPPSLMLALMDLCYSPVHALSTHPMCPH